VYCAPTSAPETLSRLQHVNVTGMQVSIATAFGGVTTAGIGFLNITSNLLYSHDLTTVRSSDWFGGVGQDVKAVKTPETRTSTTALYAYVGTLALDTNEEGILLSDTGGRTYIKAPSPPNVKFLRYGAYPAPSHWFITAGTWPESLSTMQEIEDLQNRCLRLSRHVCQPAKHLSELEIIKFNQRAYNPAARRKLSPDGKLNTYYGSISVTTNFGNNWKTVFETDAFYFNDISCANTLNCATVAEGDKNAMVYTTNDGGATWTKTLELTSSLMVSLMRVRVLSTTEAYVSGGMWDDAKGALVGLIYKSTDGCRTWSLETSVPDVGIMVGLSVSEDQKTLVGIGPTQDQRTIIVVNTRD